MRFLTSLLLISMLLPGADWLTDGGDIPRTNWQKDEKIINAGNANIYGASLDTYANWGADVVQLLNGELDTDEIINGTQVREHIQATRARWRDRTPAQQVSGFEKLFDQRTGHFSDERYLVKVPLTSINANFDRMAGAGVEDRESTVLQTTRAPTVEQRLDVRGAEALAAGGRIDRKSTRLNSSHRT